MVALVVAVVLAVAVSGEPALPVQRLLARSLSQISPPLSNEPSTACIRYRDAVAQHAVPGLFLPRAPTLKLGGNVYGESDSTVTAQP